MNARWIWFFLLTGLLASLNASAQEGRGGRVNGRVMRSNTEPINNRMVHLKGRPPASIKDGRFSFDGVPARYDLWVRHDQEPEITAYRGLTRRDPALKHIATWVTARDEHPRQASLSGIVRGEIPFPLERGYQLSFHFCSPGVAASYQLSSHSEIRGPRFGRMQVRWSGPASVKGVLIVLASRKDEQNHWQEAYLGRHPMVITDKGEAMAEVKLDRVPLGHIAGVIKVPYEKHWSGLMSFRLSDNRGVIDLACAIKAGAYDCLVPDLTNMGGDYCMRIIDGISDGSEAQHCGGRIGMTDFSLDIEAPPKVKRPEASDSKTVLSWSGDGKAVYVVELRPQFDMRPRTGPPEKGFDLTLYTSGTRLTHKDLEPLGIKLVDGRGYRVTVARLYPFRTVDEIASVSGPLSATAELRRAAAPEMEFTVGR